MKISKSFSFSAYAACLWSVLLAMAILFSGPVSAADARMPFPSGDALPGWSASEKALLFTKSDLYGHIDGGAELFLEFGFEQLGVQNYVSSGKEMAVEIYRMTDNQAALGIYLMKSGPEASFSDFVERHSLSKFQLMFCKNRFLVIVNRFHQESDLPSEVKEMGKAVARLIPAETYPDYFAELPAENRIPFTPRLLRGPLALQSIFTFGEDDLLQLPKTVNAVSSGYRRSDGKAFQRILLRFADAPTAQTVFEKVRRGLDPYLKKLLDTPDRLVFRDYAGEFGEILLQDSRLQIQVRLMNNPNPLLPTAEERLEKE